MPRLRRVAPVGVLLVAAALGAGCASTPEGGGGVDPQEWERVQKRVAGLRQALGKQGQEIAELQKEMQKASKALSSLKGLSERVGKLTDQVHALSGTAEVNGHELDRISQQFSEQITQIQARLSDFDDRLTRMEEESLNLKNGEGEEGSQGASGQAADKAPEQSPDEKAYRAAFHELRLGNYEKANAGFREFLGRFPESDYTAKARYWLGESYYVREQYEAALEAFRQVTRQYPDSEKTPPAMLKMGYAYYELQDYRMARKTLLRLVEKYPDHRVANLARKRLERIRKEQL